MPPRKRPPQPAKASETPPETKPKMSPPSAAASAPGTDKEVRILPDAALAGLPAPERLIYKLVFAGGDKGMAQTEIRIKMGMPASTLTKHLRNLTGGKSILKVVNSVHKRAEKIYMDSRLDPSPEITGGTWYRNGQLDSVAVASARRRCLDQVDKLGVAPADAIHEGISRDCPGVAYSIEQVRDILRTMALDRELEEVRSTGVGQFSDHRAGKVCYRRGGVPQGGMMERIPCGVCPRIDECSPDGVISPSTCVYYKKWLQMDF
ncbi:DNA-directed RNA polymerase III subunit rpc6 [Oryza brachyantha]|uniref:RNA polymerase III subunit C6 n=1 Tax=Oryza brachyantha TaxID=4533 RepID=J3MFK7_ORYBR|nr:DNA-directed RNA polymerase III subunit rpc6 [Oryza brachyantha]